uniref:PKD domain-containing protein n=4 Tax=Macrostomum lignano TaxID=282301 RepID=A0A1I8GUP3_9PLAT
FVCVTTATGPNSSLIYSTASVQIACASLPRNCTPLADVEVAQLVFNLNNETWIRRYPASIAVSHSLNLLSGLPIEAVPPPRTNFQPTAFLASDDMGVIESTTDADCDQSSLRQGLQNNSVVNCIYMFNVSAAVCPSLKRLCVIFNNSASPSYTESEYSNNLGCVALLNNLSCSEVAVLNPICNVSASMLTPNDTWTLTAAWLKGSAVQVIVSVSNNQTLVWDWLTAGHISHYYSHYTQLSMVFKEDVGRYNFTCTVRNDAKYYVILQENITFLWFNASQTLVQTNQTFQLEFSVVTGSHVSYQLNFGNGSTSFVTDAQMLAWKAPELLNLFYESPGFYQVTVVASNYHTQSEFQSVGVLVQNPVRELVLQAPQFVELSADNASLVFFHSDPQPTNASCRIIFGNLTDIIELTVQPVQIPIKCYRALLPEPELAKLTCWNLVSEVHAPNSSVHCQEAVSGLAWTGPMALQRAEAGIYSLSVVTGSALRIRIDCGDGRILSPNFTGNTSVQYPSVGNFTITVSVWNDVSNITITFGPVVVQEPVRDLILEYNSSVLYTPAEVQFRLTSPVLFLTNMHCVFSWAEFGSRYLYVDTLSSAGEVTLTQGFTRAALGLRNFSLNCSNLISHQSIPITVDIVLDAVIIGSFQTNGTTFFSNATYFLFNITRFGTNGCFVIDFGDSTNISFGVPSLCQPYSTTHGINFTEISYENTSLTFSHVYPQLGGYSVTVFAFNHVSNDTAETVAIILDWMCDYPKLNFSHLGVQLDQWDPDLPLNQMRSQEAVVDGIPELNCSKTSATVRQWRVETPSGALINLSFPDSFTLRLPERSLWYGLYKIVLNVSMAGVTPEVSSEFAFYINITKTPLSLNFSSSAPVSVGYNKTVSLELEPRDWDVDAGNFTGMSFRWICMQQSEVSPNPSTSIVSPPDSQGLADFKGCFGNGVGVVLEGNEHAAFALMLNTWHMMPNMSYVLRAWVFKDSRSTFADWQLFVDPQGLATIRIVENTLTTGVVYVVQVTSVGFAQEGPVTVSKDFVVNKPAGGGNCTIEPREGIAMDTKFRISCWGWIEFNVTASSLTYEYRIRPKGSRRTILLFYGPTAVSPEVVLPVGSSTSAYKSDAYINVIDSVGDKIAFIFDVTVYPPPIPASELLSEITSIMDGTSDALSQHLNSGNQQGAATTLMCLTSVMNAKNEDAEGANATSEKTAEFNERMTELRTKLVEVVSNFSVNTPEDLEQTNDVLRTAIPSDRTNQVNIHAQAANNEACLNSTLDSCVGTTPASNTAEVNAKVRGVIESVLTAVDSVTEILLNNSGSYSISDPALSVQGLRLNGSNENITFESALGDASLPPISGCDSVKAVFSGRSPYVWQPKTSVASPVLMIDKKGCRSRRDASGTESFTFSLPATTEGAKAVINATPTDRWLSFYHNVNVTFGVLQVTVQPLNGSHLLQVFVQLDRLPTPEDYLMNSSQSSFYLQPVSNGTYYIGVQRVGCYREPTGEIAVSCPDPSLSYEFGLSQYDCLIWDASLEIWTKPTTGGSCTVEASEVPNRPRFVSNLFGSLGAGMNVLPNLIDFGTLFDNWQGKLADSAAVLGTVVALWVIFIPIAIWLRRVDNKDKQKFVYLPLIDDQKEQFVYKIDVYTASEKRKGGTKGCPIMSVTGELHREALRVLSDGIREHLGDILEIELSLEGPKTVTPWLLRRVIITDMSCNVSYIFVTSETILPHKEPTSIELAKKDQLAYQQNFVKTNLSRKFLDDHLWMSVVKRKTDTNFSRLQRFGVCFCLLFLTMISNAMFYGVGEGGQSASDTITIGPIKLSVNTLFTSMLGAVVVVPVSAAVTIFFLKSKKRKSASESEERNSSKETGTEQQSDAQCESIDDTAVDPNDLGIVIRPKKCADLETPGTEGGIINPASTPLVPQQSELPSAGFQLPYWFQYIGWALVLGSMLGAGVFLVFYAMQWGKEKSQQWLLSFVLSFVQTAFLVQPLKVALIGFILIVLFRKDYDVENFTLIRVRYFNETLQREGVAFLYELEAKDRQNPVRKAAINATLKLVLTVLLLLLQYCICYGNIDPGMFRLHKSVKTHLNYDDFASVTGTASQLYSVINSSILPAVYPSSATFLVSDGCGYRLSRVSVRQLRRRRNQSQSDFIRPPDDETGCFSPGWADETPCNLSASLLAQAFMNRPDGAPYNGLLADYRGGGFVALLPDGLGSSQAFLTELKRLNWLDSHTKLVVIELDLFYSDVNLFTSVAMATELQSFGGAQASSQLLSTRLYRYVGAVGVFALVSEILAGILTLLRIVFLLVQLCDGRKFWTNFENWLDIGVIIFMVIACAFYGLRTAGTGGALEAAINGGRPQLRQLLLLNEFFFYSLGFSSFLLQLSLLGLIKFSSSLGHLFGTLKSSLSHLSSFAVFFCVIFFAFCFLMNQLLGAVQMEFNSPLGTMSTMFSAMLGKFDMATVSSHGMLPKLAFSLYVSFLIFIVVNLFVVILNDSYEGAKDTAQGGVGGAGEFQIVQFVMQRLRDTFVSKDSRQSYKDHEDLDSTVNRMSTKFGIIDSMLSNYERSDRKYDRQICLSITESAASDSYSCNRDSIVSGCSRRDLSQSPSKRNAM